MVDGEWWVLRINNFPDHPLCTLFVDGERQCDVEDRGVLAWDFTTRDDDGPDQAESVAAVAAVHHFSVYGSEVGRPCGNACCLER